MTKAEKIKDVVWGIISLIFIIFICFLYFSRTSTWFTPRIDFSSEDVKSYNLTLHNSCHISITEPTIILRLDDVRAYSKKSKEIIDSTINRNMSITIGVIPANLEKDKDLLGYLNKIKSNNKVEIAQHGYFHNETDINISRENAIKGSLIIQALLKIKPISYIPPYNKLNENNAQNLSEVYSIIADDKDILKEGESFVRIGWNQATHDYVSDYQNNVSLIIDNCKRYLDRTNLCVIVIHPQEYENKYNDYNYFLDEISSLNVSFKNLKDIVYCS